MPTLAERAAENTALIEMVCHNKLEFPKPAPIPEGIDVQAAAEPKADRSEEPFLVFNKKLNSKKNASIGLISIVGFHFGCDCLVIL